MLSSAHAPAEPGQHLENRYRLLEPIGSGGMADVWRAHDEQLDRDVAVKIVHGELSTDSERSAAEAEARSAARLVHPNIVRVYDVGRNGDFDFVVMELVQGSPLAELPALPTEQIIEIAAQIAAALEHAHNQGIVHCDVKPQNIIVTDDGDAKLLDFGIAQPSTAVTRHSSGEFLGSLPYVAPEQVRGEPVDGRTDVYALGAVLYEALTGRVPFTSLSAEDSLRHRLSSPPPPPRALSPAIPEAVDAIVMTALAPRADERFQSAGEFCEALREAMPVASNAATQPYPVAPVSPPVASPRRRVMLAVLLAVGIVGVGIASLLSAASSRSPVSSGTVHGYEVVEPRAVSPTATSEPALAANPPVEEPAPTAPPPARVAPPPSAPQPPAQVVKSPPGQDKKSGGPKGKHGRD
jgi:serine/threonine protein kinase